MRLTTSITFYCRESKKNKQGEAPIELSIVLNGQRKFINLALKCSPNKFKQKRPQHVQQYIDNMRVNVEKAITEMVKEGTPITIDKLRDYIRYGGVKSYTVEDLFSEYYQILRDRVGVSLTFGVYRKYERIRDEFFTHVGKDSQLNTITPSVIESFQNRLNMTRKLSTTCGMLTKLKSVFRYAIDNNKMVINPFQTIKIRKGKPNIEYLTTAEIDKLKNAKVFNAGLQKVLDMFIFQINSGLSYADLVDLKKEDIVMVDGLYVINKQRLKTSTEYTAVILPDGVDILKKYGWSLPHISNQKTNAYLKCIADIAGIDKNLHTHLARHTYAQQLLSSGVRLETVSRMLGHHSTTITQTYYAKIRQDDIVHEINQLKGKDEFFSF